MESYFDYLPDDILTEILINLSIEDLTKLWSIYFNIEKRCYRCKENFWYRLRHRHIPHEMTISQNNSLISIYNINYSIDNSDDSTDDSDDYGGDDSDESSGSYYRNKRDTCNDDIETYYVTDFCCLTIEKCFDKLINNPIDNPTNTKNDQYIYYMIKYGKLDISCNNYYIIRYLCDNNLVSTLEKFLNLIPGIIKFFNLIHILKQYNTSRTKIINIFLDDVDIIDIINNHLTDKLISLIIRTQDINIIKKALIREISHEYVDHTFIEALKTNNKKVIKLFSGIKYIYDNISNRSFVASCQYGNIKIVKKLLSHPKIDPNFNDGLAFKTAVTYNRCDVIELLLQNDKIKQYDFKEAFLEACSKKYLDVINMLVEIDYLPNNYIYEAIDQSVSFNSTVADILIEQYHDINFPKLFCSSGIASCIHYKKNTFFKMFENPQIRKQMYDGYLINVSLVNDNYQAFKTIVTSPEYTSSLDDLKLLLKDTNEMGLPEFNNLVATLIENKINNL